MPFSSGTFSVVYNWTTESGAPPIEIAKLDTQHADFATGLSNCILRDGSGLPTAAIPWNSQNLTGVAQLEAARFVPTGSTVPSNGMYLPAANTVAFASNTTLRGSVNSTGNWTIAAPSSGATLAVTGLSGGTAQTWTDGTVTAGVSFGSSIATFGATSNHATQIISNNAQRVLVAAAGNVTINAPSSGVALSINGVTGGAAIAVTAGAATAAAQFIAPSGTDVSLSYFATASREWRTIVRSVGGAFTIRDESAGADRVLVSTAGNVTINAPSSGGHRVNGTLGINLDPSSSATVPLALQNASYLVWRNAANTNFDWGIRTNSSDVLEFVNGGNQRVAVVAAGNVTINAPSSGVALTVTAPSAGSAISLSDGTVGGTLNFGGTVLQIGTTSAHGVQIATNNTSRIAVSSAGNATINAPSSGTALTVTGVAGGAGAIINGSVHTPPVAVTFSATAMTVNCTLSNVFTTTFTANVTTAPTLSNPQDGQTINWFITQDATGGRTMTWPSTFRWPGGVAGVLSTAANAVDLMVATYRSGPNAWYASLSKGFA